MTTSLNDILFLRGIDISKRNIILNAAIDEEALGLLQLADQVLDLTSAPYTVRLTTTGGDVESGLAMYDIIRRSRENATIIVEGFAYSMGCIILQAAKKRLLLPNSHIMAHWGYQGVEDTSQDNFKIKLKHNKQLDDICNSILLERMREIPKQEKMQLSTVEKKTRVDWYLDGEEAKKYGLVDGVFGI